MLPPDVPFLITEISKLFFDTIDATLRKDGMQKYPPVLIALSKKDGLSQQVLTQITHFKPSSISVSLRDMEADGLVRRVSDEEDQRVMRVYLTDKGRALDACIRDYVSQLNCEMTQGLTEEEVTVLLSSLTRVRNNMLKIKDQNDEKQE